MIEKVRQPRPEVSRGPRTGPAGAASLLCVLSGALLSGCNVSDLLTVDNPSEILAEDLRNVEALPVLINGVAGDFAELYDQAILHSGHFAHELIHTGSMFSWRALNSGVTELGGPADDVYDDAVKANWVADDAVALIQELFPDPMSRPEMAKASIYGGFARLVLADNFCAITIDGGPPLSPMEVYEQAVGKFTAGIEAADEAADADLRLRALAGRARASLMLDDFESARDDARQIPEGWRFVAIYSESNGPQNSVATHTIPEFRKEGGVHPRFYEDPRYATDPRLNFINQGPDFVGEDRIRQFVIQTKYMERSSPAPIASWQEARLIEAEAEVKLGNVPNAIGLVDEIRGYAGLPQYDGPATADDVLEQIMFERSVETFLEAKYLNDLRRTGDPLLDGRNDCFPISERERQTNPNLQGGG